MKARVCQIIPYFGKWPEWIELYLYSCSRNPMVDFLIYTDCPVENFPKYDNVKFRSVGFDEYCRMVSTRLGIKFEPERAYKLCDLRPFFALIHKDDIRNYEFWSFGDQDILLGDLSVFVNDKVLTKYDVLTTHDYRIAGHFTILRNDDKYTGLCLRIPQWQDKLTDKKSYGLDEGWLTHLIAPRLPWAVYVWNKLLKHFKVNFNAYLWIINRILVPGVLFKEFRTTPAPNVNEVWIYDVDNSRIHSPKGLELPYLHFLFFKKTPYYDTENYWREGFYRLGSIEDIKSSGKILIDLSGIHYVCGE